jgi:hypothetical protein
MPTVAAAAAAEAAATKMTAGQFWGEQYQSISMLFLEEQRAVDVGDFTMYQLVIRKSFGLFAAMGKTNYLRWCCSFFEKMTWTDSKYVVALRTYCAFPVQVRSRISWDELMETFNLTQKKLGVKCVSSFTKTGGVANTLSDDLKLAETQGGKAAYSKKSSLSTPFAQTGNIMRVLERSGVHTTLWHARVAPDLIVSVVHPTLEDAVLYCLPGSVLEDTKLKHRGTVTRVSNGDDGIVAEVEWIVGDSSHLAVMTTHIVGRCIDTSGAYREAADTIKASRAATELERKAAAQLAGQGVSLATLVSKSSVVEEDGSMCASPTALLGATAVGGGGGRASEPKRYVVVSTSRTFESSLKWTLSGKDAAAASRQASAAAASVGAGVGMLTTSMKDIVQSNATTTEPSVAAVSITKKPPKMRPLGAVLGAVQHGEDMLRRNGLTRTRGEYYDKIYKAMANLCNSVLNRRAREVDETAPIVGAAGSSSAVTEAILRQRPMANLQRLAESVQVALRELEMCELDDWGGYSDVAKQQVLSNLSIAMDTYDAANVPEDNLDSVLASE